MDTKLILGLAATLALGGCIAHENDRMTLGRSVQLEAFHPPEAVAPPEGVPVLAEQTPSLTMVVRSNWEPMAVVVPVDGTAHRPLYYKTLHLTDHTARQRQEYPTPLSALEMTNGSEGQQQLEALANQGLGIVDLVLLIPRAILEPPWRTQWSPQIAHQRYWHPELTPAVMQVAPAEPLPPEPPVTPIAT